MKKKARIVQTHEGMSEFYRLAVLKAIDEAWIEEVDTLQQLKGVITTRSTAQKEVSPSTTKNLCAPTRK